MSERITCPHCGDRIRVGAASSGRSRVVCPSCKGRFVVGDDEDDRPRRRRKSRKASGGMGLWIGVGIGVAAMVLLVGGAVAVLLLRGGPGLGPGGEGDGRGSRGGGGGAPAEMIAYLPSDAFQIQYSDVKAQRQVFGNDKSRMAINGAKVEDLERDFGSLDNVVGVLHAMRSGNFTRGQNVLVVRCSAPIDRARLTAGGKEMEAGGKKFYEMKSNKDAEGFGKAFGEYLYFPSDNILARADTRALMTDMISAGGQLPEALKGCSLSATATSTRFSRRRAAP